MCTTLIRTLPFFRQWGVFSNLKPLGPRFPFFRHHRSWGVSFDSQTFLSPKASLQQGPQGGYLASSFQGADQLTKDLLSLFSKVPESFKKQYQVRDGDAESLSVLRGSRGSRGSRGYEFVWRWGTLKNSNRWSSVFLDSPSFGQNWANIFFWCRLSHEFSERSHADEEETNWVVTILTHYSNYLLNCEGPAKSVGK